MALGTSDEFDQQNAAIKHQLAKLTALVQDYTLNSSKGVTKEPLPTDIGQRTGQLEVLVKETYRLLHTIKGPLISVFSHGEQIFHTGALRALLELGVFHVLPMDGTSMSATVLATKLHADKELLVRLMRMCTIWGPFKETDVETYAHTPFSIAYMEPQVMDIFKLVVDEYVPAGVQLHEFFKANGWKDPTNITNCPYTFAHRTEGKNMWDYMVQFPDRFKVFNSALYAQSASATWPVTLYPFRETLTQSAAGNAAEPIVVDIGGGKGQALRVIRKMCGDINARFILQDRPEVLDDISHELPGIEKMPYDIFTPQIVKGASIYFIRRVLHDWAEDACIDILKNIATAISDKKAQRVIISEKLLPDKGVDAESSWVDLADLTLTGAERNLKQWERIANAAGFELGKIYQVDGASDAAIECFLK